MPTALSLSRGYVCYGSTRIVDVDSFVVHEGSNVLVSGPNGSGKTSLFRAIGDLGAQFTGDTWLLGRNAQGLRSHSRIRIGLRFMPQDHSAFERLGANDHWKLAETMFQGKRSGSAPTLDLPSDVISWRKNNVPTGQLSRGQAKLLLLFSMFLSNPKLLLLDEPYAGFDEIKARHVASLITRATESGAACIIADHTGLAVKQVQIAQEYRLQPPADSGGVFALKRSVRGPS